MESSPISAGRLGIMLLESESETRLLFVAIVRPTRWILHRHARGGRVMVRGIGSGQGRGPNGG